MKKRKKKKNTISVFLFVRGENVVEFYNRCIDIYDDYRAHVPSYASAALSFYLLLLLVPATSLFAVGASFFKLDLTIVERLIEQYIAAEYVDVILNILQTNTMNTVAFVTLLLSLYTVSRGVRHIYDLSRNMYGESEDENIFEYYMYSIKVTILLLVLFLGFVAIFAVKPLAQLLNSLYAIVGIRHILLYFILVVILMMIYKVVPRTKIGYEESFKGALIAGALLLILYYGLQIYFQFASFQTIYGPLASIVAVLFVFNLGAEIFYIGMYTTYIFYLRRKEDERDSHH